MRTRPIPDVSSSDRLDETLWQLLHDPDPTLRLYVYRLRGGRKVTPALLNCDPFPDLFEYLRDRYGTADYCIMIRRGRRMAFVGAVSIEAPLSWYGRSR